MLVAISIPIFTSQLEKSRESTDLANIRDIYAEISTGILTNDMDQNGKTMTVANSLTATTTTTSNGFTISVPSAKVSQKVANWQSTSPNVAGVSLASDNCPGVSAGTTTITFTFTIANDTSALTGISFT